MIRILPSGDDDGRFLLYDGDAVCGDARVIYGEQMQIVSVEAPDDLLKEGMIRAVLNAARIREIPTAFCENKELFDLLRRLEFTPCDRGMQVDVAEFFFRGCCENKEVD